MASPGGIRRCRCGGGAGGAGAEGSAATEAADSDCGCSAFMAIGWVQRPLAHDGVYYWHRVLSSWQAIEKSIGRTEMTTLPQPFRAF
jgi:hypothetical protein